MYLCVDVHCPHAESFDLIFVVQLFSDRLYLIIVVTVYHPNIRNVFQVFRSCNHKEVTIIYKEN
jgi:hypothetical protein